MFRKLSSTFAIFILVLVAACSQAYTTDEQQADSLQNSQQDPQQADSPHISQPDPQQDDDQNDRMENTQVTKENHILLGLRTDPTGKGELSTYRTLLIAIHGSKANVLVELPYLIVPDKEGQLYRLNVQHYVDDINEYGVFKQLQYLEYYPVGDDEPELQKVDYEEDEYYFESLRRMKIHFVSQSGYLTLGQRSEYHQKDDRYSWPLKLEEDIQVLHLPDQQPVTFTEVFGAESQEWVDQIQKEEITLQELDEVNSDVLDPVHVERSQYHGQNWESILFVGDKANLTNENNWAIVHQQGGWVPKIAKRWEESISSSYIGMRIAEVYQLKDVPISLPSSMVSLNSVQPDWSIMKQKIPEAIDAVSIPEQDAWIVMTDTSLFMDDNLIIPTQPGEVLIMTELIPSSQIHEWLEYDWPDA